MYFQVALIGYKDLDDNIIVASNDEYDPLVFYEPGFNLFNQLKFSVFGLSKEIYFGIRKRINDTDYDTSNFYSSLEVSAVNGYNNSPITNISKMSDVTSFGAGYVGLEYSMYAVVLKSTDNMNVSYPIVNLNIKSKDEILDSILFSVCPELNNVGISYIVVDNIDVDNRIGKSTYMKDPLIFPSGNGCYAVCVPHNTFYETTKHKEYDFSYPYTKLYYKLSPSHTKNGRYHVRITDVSHDEISSFVKLYSLDSYFVIDMMAALKYFLNTISGLAYIEVSVETHGMSDMYKYNIYFSNSIDGGGSIIVGTQ